MYRRRRIVVASLAVVVVALGAGGFALISSLSGDAEPAEAQKLEETVEPTPSRLR